MRDIVFPKADTVERLYPTAAVCRWYFSHPEAKYFSLGLLGADQVRDYAERKGVAVEYVEKWLGQSLAYTPGAEARASAPAG